MKIAFTIATVSYLAQAKTLADSLLEHNPEFVFYIVLLDKLDQIDISFFTKIQLLEVEQIGIPFFYEMVDRYSIFELSNALKPFCAEYLLNEDRCEMVMYLDSDIVVYNKFTSLDSIGSSHNIIITPHVMNPPPYDGLYLSENAFLNTGIYNGGFFVVLKNSESFRFLEWLKERLRTKCFVDLAQGMFVDQIWLNLVPLYFKKVKILKDLGYNMAFWNLHERTVTCNAEGCLCVKENTPLVFFHFSGYDFNDSETLSKYQSRFSLQERLDILPLYQSYATVVKNNGYNEFSQINSHYLVEKENRKKMLESSNPVITDIETTEIEGSRENLIIRIWGRCKLSLRVLLKGA